MGVGVVKPGQPDEGFANGVRCGIPVHTEHGIGVEGCGIRIAAGKLVGAGAGPVVPG
jgi:hypothetical protein